MILSLAIDNRTHYSTQSLRAFLTAAILSEGDPERAYKVTVTSIRRNGGWWTSGYAYYHSGTFRLRLPTRDEHGGLLAGLPKRSLRDAAVTTVHELMHCRGLRHRDMPAGMKRCGGSDYPTPWLHDGLQIVASKTQPAEHAAAGQTTEERRAALLRRREEKAAAMLVRWQRRLRLARTKVRRYSLSVRRYERRRQAANDTGL